MAEGYDAMRCSYLDDLAEKCIGSIRKYAAEVKETVRNEEISAEESDKAVREAIMFFSQSCPGVPGKVASTQKGIADLNNELAGAQKEIANLNNKLADFQKEIANLNNKLADTQKDIANIQNEVENNKRQMEKERSKHSTQMKKLGKEIKETKQENALAIQSSKKSLAFLRSTIRKKAESTQPNDGAKELSSHPLIEIPGPSKECVKVDLRLEKNCRLKDPLKAASITDCVAFSEDSFLLAEHTDKESRIGLYNLEGKEIKSWVLEKKTKKTKVAVLHAGNDFIVSKGDRIDRHKFDSLEPSTIHKSDKFDIYAIAALSSTNFAAAVQNCIHLMDTGGTVYKTIHMQAPAIDMCATTDDKLIIHQAGGLCEVDIHDKGTVLKEVPQIKSISSVSGFSNGSFFVCDSKEKALYLLGPDIKTIQNVWLVPEWFKEKDELKRVSVYGNKCVCVTKFCYMLVFEIIKTAFP
ncbi:hypothetical protein RRG08_034006 [Elysia crispata]|uniref:Uncharacterized protein n=1 Tax=Elysia crispata TaxID=231223 RepID=A0AAE1CL12_9GAST|nr:hypothetical protein RRG08_034006 [Elysia crispata]